MRKKIKLALAASLAALMLTACGNAESGEEVDEALAANATELKIIASNFEFDQAEYRVKKGEPYKIVLENAQGIHGIEIKKTNVRLDNRKKSQIVTFDQAGEYSIVCSISCGPGHLNMKSTLIVEE